MAVSLADSQIWHRLYGDADTATLFTDSAELRALLLVEGALAEAQGKLGLIPEVSAKRAMIVSLSVAGKPITLTWPEAIRPIVRISAIPAASPAISAVLPKGPSSSGPCRIQLRRISMSGKAFG